MPMRQRLAAALEAARADKGSHGNECIYNEGYADGLAAAIAIVDGIPATVCSASGQCPYHASGGPETIRCGTDLYLAGQVKP